MKSPQHTTPTQAGPSLHEISGWYQRLHELHARLRPHFARPEVHQHALGSLQAVLSDVPRKNGWQSAEQARQARPYGMQRLLAAAVWDQDAVRDELRRLVLETRWPGPDRSRVVSAPRLVRRPGSPARRPHPGGGALCDQT